MKKELIYYGSYGFQFSEKLTEKQKTANFQIQCPFSPNTQVHLLGFFNATDIFFTLVYLFIHLFYHVLKVEVFILQCTAEARHGTPSMHCISISIRNSLSFLTIWPRSLLCKWLLWSTTIWIMWPLNKESAKLAAASACVLSIHLHMLPRNVRWAALKFRWFTGKSMCSDHQFAVALWNSGNLLVRVEHNVTDTSARSRASGLRLHMELIERG